MIAGALALRGQARKGQAHGGMAHNLCAVFLSLLYAFALPRAALAQGKPSAHSDISASLSAQLAFCPSGQGIPQSAQAESLILERLSLKQPEIERGIGFILQEKSWSALASKVENPALSLYARLLAGLSPEARREPDCLIEAQCLANNYLYSIATAEAKSAIVADCFAQRQIYLEIIAAQKAQGLSWGLGSLPLAPKLLWAERLGPSFWEIANEMFAHGLPLMDLELYREFVDSPESLRLIRSILVKADIIRPSLRESVRLIERFVEENRAYRSSMENLEDFQRRGIFSQAELDAARAQADAGGYERLYRGKTRRWDAFNWLNAQCTLYAQAQRKSTEGRFQGDCGTTTTVQMAFFRMAGIAPLSIQWIHYRKIPAFTHNCPGYYHPAFQRWFANQKPVFYEGGKALSSAEPTFIHYSKPVWHSLRYANDWRLAAHSPAQEAIHYSYYPGEFSDNHVILSLLSIGIPASVLDESLWRIPDGLSSGKLIPKGLNAQSAADRDFDGIPDLVERELGSEPLKLDTDGDGRSDLYEIELGRSPLRPDPWGTKEAQGSSRPALDGIIAAKEYAQGSRLSDVAGDSADKAPGKDIKSMQALVSADSLFCGISFQSPLSHEPATHSFLIEARGSERRRYWAQWHQGYAQLYELSGPADSILSPLGSRGLSAGLGQDGEFSIPLSAFPGATVLYIRYHASGMVSGLAQISDDYTDFLRLSLPGDSFISKAKAALAKAQTLSDPAKDAKPLPLDYDFTSLSAALRDGYLYARVDFAAEPESQAFGLKTIHVRDPQKLMNYWIQWWSPLELALHSWKDGESAQSQPIDASDYECAFEGSSLYLSLPRSALGPPGSRELYFHAGGLLPRGGFEASADISPAFSLKEE